MNGHFDTIVVGAGPAGIAAAVCAAESGACVALLDDNPAPGGQIWRRGAAQSSAARAWLARLEASKVIRMQGWHVFEHPEHGVLLAECDSLVSSVGKECAELRYDALILATGARERFLPFPGWTLPNVMGVGGLDAMARGGLPLRGKRVVVAGTGPLLLAVSAHLAQHGARVVAICEQAPLARLIPFAIHLVTEPRKLVQAINFRAATAGARFYPECWPVVAQGNDRLESVTLQQNGRRRHIACDYLACGFHLIPNLELPALIGCRIENGFVAVNDILQSSIPGVFCVGELTGIGGVEMAVLDGQIAGLAAAGLKSTARSLIERRNRGRRFVHALARTFQLDPALRNLPADDTIVCRCEDVSFSALLKHVSARDAKLHTRCGMGPCQGRICGSAGEFLFGWLPDTVRPPILTAKVASLGRSPQSQEQTIS